MEEALAGQRPSPAAEVAAALTPDAQANSPAGLAATTAMRAQRLPWPEDQLPLADLLGLLYWLQQHAVRLQLAPGAAADLYMDPDLEVYAALRVPMLAMQSRPTLIGGDHTQQQEGVCRATVGVLVCMHGRMMRAWTTSHARLAVSYSPQL